MFPLFFSQYRTDFDYLQEIPVLTLDVNEDFKGKKDKYDHMIEKVKFHKQHKWWFMLLSRYTLHSDHPSKISKSQSSIQVMNSFTAHGNTYVQARPNLYHLTAQVFGTWIPVGFRPGQLDLLCSCNDLQTSAVVCTRLSILQT